ncbi:hypothetical protein BCR32DRAFT_290854 [Anaeromyces robustus]|uniref:E3 ubiquitin-protein ligase UBR1-like winged-helix domain-containing protein n=1 Tax=Anaeromyces robustus TaxID=1754192 RepID=A0A1Y1XHF7_9FUNG|nr:hypothetical protein BCR32DRAFT_290854 [Anaeromyces robustus]|eukprot:ORX85189.1 hypothetical protein BCR32DRAFT_290854 [Anaeromyces robustus]
MLLYDDVQYIIQPDPQQKRLIPLAALKVNDEFLEHLQSNPENITIQFGSTCKILSNKEEFEFTITPEKKSVAVDYIRMDDSNSNSLEICGRLSHMLEMKGKMGKQLSYKLKNKYESERNNRTSIVLNSEQISNIKKQNSRIKNKTRLYEAPVKSKLRSTSPLQATGGLDLKKRIIHMLAPKPMKLANLCKMLKIKETEPELKNILETISTKNTANEFKLNPELYKEVDLQTWHTWDHNQRNQAIENARKAFEEMNLPPSAPEWNKLTQKKAMNISAPVIQPVNQLVANNDTNQRKVNSITSEKRATKQIMSQLKSRNKRANASTAKAVKTKRNEIIPIANHSVAQQAQTQAQTEQQKKNIEEMNALANSIISNHQETTTKSKTDKRPTINKRNVIGKTTSGLKDIDRLPKIKKKSLSQIKKEMAESSQNEQEEDISSLSAVIPPRKLTNKRKRMDSSLNPNPKSKITLQPIEPLVISEPISTFNDYNNMIEKYNKHQQELQKLDKSMKDISESYNKRRRDLKKFDSSDLLERKLYTEFKEKAQELTLIKKHYNTIYSNLQTIKEKLDVAKENLINSI